MNAEKRKLFFSFHSHAFQARRVNAALTALCKSSSCCIYSSCKPAQLVPSHDLSASSVRMILLQFVMSDSL